MYNVHVHLNGSGHWNRGTHRRFPLIRDHLPTAILALLKVWPYKIGTTVSVIIWMTCSFWAVCFRLYWYNPKLNRHVLHANPCKIRHMSDTTTLATRTNPYRIRRRGGLCKKHSTCGDMLSAWSIAGVPQASNPGSATRQVGSKNRRRLSRYTHLVSRACYLGSAILSGDVASCENAFLASDAADSRSRYLWPWNSCHLNAAFMYKHPVRCTIDCRRVRRGISYSPGNDPIGEKGNESCFSATILINKLSI